MMSLRRRSSKLAASLALALVTAAVPVFGQYLPPAPARPPGAEPLPTPPSSGEAPTSPLESSAEPESKQLRPSGWEALLVLDGAWEENVGFSTPAGPDDTFGSARAVLTRFQRTPRSEIRIGSWGAGYLYREQDTRNRADGGVNLDARSNLSRRVTGRLGGSYTYGHSDDIAFVESGVLLPLTRAQTGFGTAALTWRASERTSLSVEGGWSGYFFEEEGLSNRETWRAGASLARQVSRAQSVDLRFEFVRNRQGPTGVQTEDVVWKDPTLTLGYRGTISRGLGFELRAGASRSTALSGGAAGDAPQWGFDGSAGLSGKIGRSSIGAFFTHGLEPTVALGGQQRSSTLNLSLTVPVGRRVELLTRGTGSLREDVNAPEGARNWDGDVYAGLSVRLAHRLRAVAGYRIRYRNWPELGGEAWNNRASLSLVWGGGDQAGGFSGPPAP